MKITIKIADTEYKRLSGTQRRGLVDLTQIESFKKMQRVDVESFRSISAEETRNAATKTCKVKKTERSVVPAEMAVTPEPVVAELVTQEVTTEMAETITPVETVIRTEPVPFAEQEVPVVSEPSVLILEQIMQCSVKFTKYYLNIGGDNFYVELLFYNFNFSCYILIELKAGELKLKYAGLVKFRFVSSGWDSEKRQRQSVHRFALMQEQK